MQPSSITTTTEQFLQYIENGLLVLTTEAIHSGADIHAHHDDAFRWSAEKGHLPIVQCLLQHGADIQIGIAASSDQPKFLAWLLSYQHALEEKIRLTNHLTTQGLDFSHESDSIKLFGI